jgi:uncharacterized protein YndB with AHSA1/START domain
MKTLHFTTLIHAGREAVWNAMLAPETYKIWTAEFVKARILKAPGPRANVFAFYHRTAVA